MLELPSFAKAMSNPTSFWLCSGARDHFILINIYDCLDYQADHIVGNLEAIHEAMVNVTCTQEAQGYGQPQPRMKGPAVTCVSLVEASAEVHGTWLATSL